AAGSPAIHTLSLHDALPIYPPPSRPEQRRLPTPPPYHPLTRRLRPRPSRTPATTRATRNAWHPRRCGVPASWRRSCSPRRPDTRSEEHTSELQSREKLVCRL